MRNAALLVLSLIMLPASAAAQRRAVMENLATTNTAIFISSTSSVYVLMAGSLTVSGSGASATRIVVGSLTMPTTVQMDVYGLLRLSSGVTTMGGAARGSMANDLQLVRAAAAQVASGVEAVIAGGRSNTASGQLSAIGGGTVNTASALYTTVAGGFTNSVSGQSGTIGGGESNSVGPNSTGGTIGGGVSNSVNDVSDPSVPSTVAGGRSNTATNTSSIGGGYQNTAAGSSTVGGGVSNTASGGIAMVVGGGDSNTASGSYSVVGGGRNNTASGQYSVAAGRQCKPSATGAFCFSDSTAADFQNNSTDTLKGRFASGYFFTGGASTFTVVVVETSESPAATDACVRGKITWDANYVYVCTASAVWKRAALTGGY